MLIFRKLNFVIISVFVEAYRDLINTLDLPALLGVDPRIGLGLAFSAHAMDDAAAQASTQRFQWDTLEHRLEEALHDNALGLRAWNATHHQVEELVFVDLTCCSAM